MKTKLSILGILLVLILSGCSNDSDSSGAIVAGKWKLVQVSGSFAGTQSNFEPGTISWEFNPKNQSVKVINNNTNENLTDLFESGTYDYSIVTSENPEICSKILKINNIDMGCFEIVNGDLKIDQAYVDGYTITLKP